ncbi:MAG: hypothetical protein ACRDRJ_18295 [Streptosporangiaceae bacterium]
MAMLDDMESRLGWHRRRHSVRSIIGLVVSMLLAMCGLIITVAMMIITGAMILLYVDLSQLRNFG